MKDLPKRFLTALVFGFVVIGSVIFSPHSFAILMTVIGAVGLHEFYSIAKDKGYIIDANILVLLGIFQIGSFVFYFNGLISGSYLLMLAIFPFLLMIKELYHGNKNPIGNIAVSVFGWIYVIVPLIVLMWCSFTLNKGMTFSYSYEFVIGYLILIWSSDTGAYFAGVTFGKRKLFKSISPKKSWEGFFGGMALSIAASLILYSFFPVLSQIDWIIISLIIIITGTLGDLVESMFKRSADIKDSGNILPGHGGVLDRFDALFCSAPFVFLYILLTRSLL